MIEVTQIRKKYYAQTTIGELYVNDRLFCYSLEDTARPSNVKVKHFTAIPEGTYFVKVRYSPTFKREMLLLYNDETQTKVTNGKISFTWIYAHGGNRHNDTSGCVIVGYKINENTVYDSAEKDLFDKLIDDIKAGKDVIWTVTNGTQTM